MIAIKDVLAIHAVLIENYGGAQGVRDLALLESALNRPFATFDALDLYPTALDKAAALIESILINHPFIDGNKRTGYVITRLYLRQNGYDISADESQKYEFVISISKGQLDFEQIKQWLQLQTLST